MINIDEGGSKRIVNACKRINLDIYLIGSRANGTYRLDSDFDYIIPNMNSRLWQKIKNSLPGAKDPSKDLPNRIDLIRSPIDSKRPFIKFKP